MGTTNNSIDTAVKPEEALRVAADGVRTRGLHGVADLMDAVALYLEGGGSPLAVEAGFAVAAEGKFLNKGTSKFTKDNVTLWQQQNHMRSHIGSRVSFYQREARLGNVASVHKVYIVTVTDEGDPLSFLERSPARRRRLEEEAREAAGIK